MLYDAFIGQVVYAQPLPCPHKDERSLADPQIDVSVLAAPNDLHAPQAIVALQAGKHVVMDKPICLNVAEADAMIAASRQSSRDGDDRSRSAVRPDRSGNEL